MRRGPSVRPAHVVGCAVVLVLGGLIGWLLIGNNGDQTGSKPESPVVSSESSPQPTPDSSVMSTERAEALAPAAEVFVATYYFRDASTTEASLRQDLTGLVTRTFLSNHLPDLSTESDEWVRRENGVITATANVIAGDSGTEPDRALVTTDITVIGTAASQVEPPYTFRVRLDMVWQNGWKVVALV